MSISYHFLSFPDIFADSIYHHSDYVVQKNLSAGDVHSRAINTSSFLQEWELTATADSFPFDTILSSQSAVKMRGLTGEPSVIGKLHRLWAAKPMDLSASQPGIRMKYKGLWITLPWAGFNGRKISSYGHGLDNVLIQMIERSRPQGWPWPGLVYILHVATVFHEFGMQCCMSGLLMCIRGAVLCPLHSGEEDGWVGGGQSWKPKGDV